MSEYKIIAIRFICLLFSVFTFSNLNAQENNSAEALELASQAAGNKDFLAAINLLKEAQKQNPDDVNVQQLLANTYYWSGDMKTASTTFEKAIKKHPEHKALHLDFGRMMFETKDYEKAKTQLLIYLQSDPTNAEALLNLGYIHFWDESYKTAENYFQKVLESYPEQAEAKLMLEKIQSIHAVQMEVNGEYGTDSQPITYYKPMLLSSQYRNDWLYPFLEAAAFFFDTESGSQQSQLIELGNHFYFKKAKTTLSVSSGIYRNHVDGQINWIGKAIVKKQLSKGLSVSALASRYPNLTTLASLEKLVFQNDYSLQLNLSNGGSWMGEAAVMQRNHGDQNPILSAYAWAMSPVLEVSRFQFRAGYSFSYEDAKESRFRNELPLDQIIAGWQDGMGIKGVYDPYFTPKNQQIHSVLAFIKINFSKKISFELNGNVGFAAKAEIPYLYLDGTGNELEIKRDFYTENKTTFDLSGKLDFQISKNTWITSRYRYVNNFFYDAHTASIGLKTSFHP